MSNMVRVSAKKLKQTLANWCHYFIYIYIYIYIPSLVSPIIFYVFSLDPSSDKEKQYKN